MLLIVSTSARPQATRSIAVTRVNLIDATGAPIKRDMTVVIDDGTISAVVPAARARVPANAQVVDGMDEAIEIFRLNTDMFQKSGNAFDSLGEAYMIKGNRERAIEKLQAIARSRSAERERRRDAEEARRIVNHARPTNVVESLPVFQRPVRGGFSLL